MANVMRPPTKEIHDLRINLTRLHVEDHMKELTSDGKLSAAWRGWNYFLKANSWVNSQQGMIEPVCMALQRLGRDTTKLTATDIDTIVMALGRAVPQIRAANCLQNATWKTGVHTETDTIRFLQIRLIMVVGGFDVAMTALMPNTGHGLPFDDNKLSQLLSGAILQTIHPPKQSRILVDWLECSEVNSQRATLDQLFQLNSGTHNTITRFLKGQAPNSIADAIKLARALRHASAHGALSPTKVKQFRLTPSIDDAAKLLTEVVAVLLAKMIGLAVSPTTP